MLVIFATHPIQYQVPLWKKMTDAGINLEVWYFTDFGTKKSYDVQFDKSFSWDLPMLEGYKYRFLEVNAGAVPNKGFKSIFIRENIKKKLRECKATHVYINGWQVFAYWQALWAAKSIGLITIFKGESNDLKPESKWKWPIKKLLLANFFKKIDHFLYIGEANKRLYKKYKIKDEKLLPGLYCIDNDRFKEQAGKLYSHKYTLRKQWGIPSNSFCILFSGKFIEKKRPLDIIYAAKQLSANKLNIHLLYVGDGVLYPEIKKEANIIFDKELGLVNSCKENELNISITGFLNQTEIPKAYAVADCLVLPSNFGETWGLVVNEAMASGCQVIISNSCGSAEDIGLKLGNKHVYHTGEIDQLYQSILHSMSNKKSSQELYKIISQYSYDSTISAVKKIMTCR
ncbi:MAG: glycosyltransferase family 4 protein [Pedobacter sp.]|uniref:glycosyltransferase family 4 protein n=1 Tax=Pedobacter sp. TaxID=1411316 RepID=UPI0028075EA5|nr:glycosyltransferase family 4 protein [Pedobacter sp.]MDQ8004883.1 glycosyltransferase family 4 protein [Pedobacter sp.]